MGNGIGITVGLGSGLSSALPTPLWRALVSVSWATQAVEIDPCKHVPKGQPLPPECPDPIRDDLDQDGILNDADACPVDPEDYDGLLDTDGCPEVDADGDTILDPVDICPLEPETVDGVKDEDGCPDDQLVALTRTSVVQLQRVSFDFAKATLKPESEPVMWAVLKLLQVHPSLVLRVEGHTDNVGSDAFNSALSVARAQACREWLVKNAADPDDIGERVWVLGLGETRPTDTNRTESGMAENRRVEFVVDSLDESAGIPLFRALEEVDHLPGQLEVEAR
jgi:outer membrane protein OmpA-like peptidoglycan-associated protein